MDEYGKIHFPNISNNIWMSTNELIELFGVTCSTLRTNVKAIYKSGILDECEVQRSKVPIEGMTDRWETEYSDG